MNYPVTPEIDETVTTGGVSFNDVYRWLAEENPNTLQWQQAQDELAQTTLAESGRVAAFEALLTPGFVAMLNFNAPQPMAGRWFHREIPAGAVHPVLRVSDQPDEPGRVLLDLATLGIKAPLLQHVAPSPDGALPLVVISANDAERNLLVCVIETATAEVKHRITGLFNFTTTPAWLPDSSGFQFGGLPDAATAMNAELPPAAGMRIFEQRLDAALTRTVIPLSHAHTFVVATISPDQRHAVLFENQVLFHPTWIRRLAPGAAWEPLLDSSFGRVKGTLVGDELIAIHSNAEFPTGHLVSIPLTSPRDRDTWRELMPAGEATLASVTLAAGKLVLGESYEGRSRLRVLRLDGAVEKEIPLPGTGAIGKFALGFIAAIVDDLVWADGDHISFVYSSLNQTPASYRYDVRADRLEALGAAPRVLDADLSFAEARADDGERVVYHVMRPKGLQGTGPTIVTGYGGFNVAWLPCWVAMAGAWIDAGGTWVHAHLRGGGEFGEEFWRAGRMDKKANTFEDLYGVLRDLVKRGISTVEQLGIFGSSNGGVLVCAAIAQHPELFAAAVPQVPIVDVHDCVRDPYTNGICAVDYGNALVPEEAQWLMSWSPYRNLRRGTRFPHVLIDSGANDNTCPPWHGRKFAAFLQNHGAADSGVTLLRVRADADHNAMSQELFIRRDAEELAFFAEHLGLAPSSVSRVASM